MAALGKPAPLTPSPQVREIEDARIKGVQASIRSFMHSADPKTVKAVPLRNASVPLTPSEAEAFHADYQGEKSFRADYVDMVMHMVAVQARMLTELADYKAKKSSAYLWKPHADSLAYLLVAAEKGIERSKGMATLAGQRGLADKVKSLQETAIKLRDQMQLVARALQA
jgi:DNA-binding phage protein